MTGLSGPERRVLELHKDGTWYSPAEVWDLLHMQPNTYNKWRHHLKKKGYVFEKRRVNTVNGYFCMYRLV